MNISYFLANKIRNFSQQSFSKIIVKIGILSVAIAIAVIALSFFVLFGFKDTIREKLFSMTSHIQVSKITLNRSFDETPLLNNDEIFSQAKQNPNIKSINKVAFKSVILKSENEIGGVVLKGVDNEYDWLEFEKNLIKGRILSPDSTNEIIISDKLAGLLNIELNEDLTAYFIQDPPRVRKLNIVGIYDSKVGEIDQVYTLTHLNLVQSINLWDEDEIGHYEIYLNNFEKLSETKAELEELFPLEYDVKTVTEILPHFFDWFTFLDRNIILIITLIMIVASFNMISVLLIMIMERTPMIGLLKSLGASIQQIRQVFIINSSRIILYGVLIGNLIVIVFSFLQSNFKLIKLDPENYYMNHVPISWAWGPLIWINIGVFALVLLVTVIPTLIISKINPVDALKYKD